jgi:hypothetical protein
MGGTLFLTLRKVRRLRVFENRVLRRIFGSEREGITGGWQKSQLPDMYSSPNIWVVKLSRLR